MQDYAPQFQSKTQVALNMEGAYCSRPERNAAMNIKTAAIRIIASASFTPRRGVYKCKHLKKQSQFYGACG